MFVSPFSDDFRFSQKYLQKIPTIKRAALDTRDDTSTIQSRRESIFTLNLIILNFPLSGGHSITRR